VTSNGAINAKLELFCVFYVDMESSTHNTAFLHPKKYALYYTTFYDALSKIAKRFNGRVIKHIGDALLIYFPATSDVNYREAFKSVVDCAMAMIDARRAINNTFHEENLPRISYRISADYGRMEPIETETSATLDWIGPSINMVAKMNRSARTNTMVIGGDLHQILSRFSFHEYVFEQSEELNIGIKQKYPIFSVAMKKKIDGAISESLSHIGHSPTLNQINEETAIGESALAAAFPRILIVDDEQDILLVYKQFLADQPIIVDIFSDPLQLLGQLALVGPSYYDIAVIDIRMPKMSGFQVYKILAALKPSINALFVSAFDYTEEVILALRDIGKENDFIRKPISRENFVCAINKRINSLNMTKDLVTCTTSFPSKVDGHS